MSQAKHICRSRSRLPISCVFFWYCSWHFVKKSQVDSLGSQWILASVRNCVFWGSPKCLLMDRYMHAEFGCDCDKLVDLGFKDPSSKPAPLGLLQYCWRRPQKSYPATHGKDVHGTKLQWAYFVPQTVSKNQQKKPKKEQWGQSEESLCIKGRKVLFSTVTAVSWASARKSTELEIRLHFRGLCATK